MAMHYITICAPQARLTHAAANRHEVCGGVWRCVEVCEGVWRCVGVCDSLACVRVCECVRVCACAACLSRLVAANMIASSPPNRKPA